MSTQPHPANDLTPMRRFLRELTFGRQRILNEIFSLASERSLPAPADDADLLALVAWRRSLGLLVPTVGDPWPRTEALVADVHQAIEVQLRFAYADLLTASEAAIRSLATGKANEVSSVLLVTPAMTSGANYSRLFSDNPLATTVFFCVPYRLLPRAVRALFDGCDGPRWGISAEPYAVLGEAYRDTTDTRHDPRGELHPLAWYPTAGMRELTAGARQRQLAEEAREAERMADLVRQAEREEQRAQRADPQRRLAELEEEVLRLRGQ